MMKSGIYISVLYNDEHLLKLRIRASNGMFSGQADVYADFGALTELAGVLRGFPTRRDDAREYETGAFDTNHAGGGAAFRFFCVDSTGHAIVGIRLRTDSRVDAGASDTAAFYIPIVAAGVDSFIEGLDRMAANIGDSAFLESAA